ncbi:MAG: hypothetical protein Ta2E_00300 [Mycoplasmoidaceae bacterium]|nr:MAG: hypothetical protein Ta2E_00300 [Mycoplasmoidaceae bacterium]
MRGKTMHPTWLIIYCDGKGIDRRYLKVFQGEPEKVTGKKIEMTKFNHKQTKRIKSMVTLLKGEGDKKIFIIDISRNNI